jgi:osmotically inducible protein OsmC
MREHSRIKPDFIKQPGPGAGRKDDMERTAKVIWEGGLKDGKGMVSSQSGAISKAAFSYSTRFEMGQGTNPEELIAAAHAACFSMAFSYELNKVGIDPTRIETTAKVRVAKRPEGWTITGVHLDTAVKAHGGNPSQFEKAASLAKENCPVSRVLKAPVQLNTRLDIEEQDVRKAG